MPYLTQPDLGFSLPFTGLDPLAQQSSLAGATHALHRASTQLDRLLSLYREHGPKTDHQAAKALKLPVATICARRNELRRQGLVKALTVVKGPFRVVNTRWGLV